MLSIIYMCFLFFELGSLRSEETGWGLWHTHKTLKLFRVNVMTLKKGTFLSRMSMATHRRGMQSSKASHGAEELLFDDFLIKKFLGIWIPFLFFSV